MIMPSWERVARVEKAMADPGSVGDAASRAYALRGG
jgi:hypothetical protein